MSLNEWKSISYTEDLAIDTALWQAMVNEWEKANSKIGTEHWYNSEASARLKRECVLMPFRLDTTLPLHENIWQELIRIGFNRTALGLAQPTIPTQNLLAWLLDQSKALDVVFNLTREEEPLTTNTIVNLHRLTMRQNDFIEQRIASLANEPAPSLAGEFRFLTDPVPFHSDITFGACPCHLIEDELEKVVSTINCCIGTQGNQLNLAVWSFFALLNITPFRTGNTVVAALLANYVLIINKLPPLSIPFPFREQLIKAIKKAQSGNIKIVWSSFAESSLNQAKKFSSQRSKSTFKSLADLSALIITRVDEIQTQYSANRETILHKTREKIFNEMGTVLKKTKYELFQIISYRIVNISSCKHLPLTERSHWFTKQVLEYGRMNHIQINLQMPRGWFGIFFNFHFGNPYALIIPIYHVGFLDNQIMVSSFLRQLNHTAQTDEKPVVHINTPPLLIDLDHPEDSYIEIFSTHLHDTMEVCLSYLAQELNETDFGLLNQLESDCESDNAKTN